MGDAEAMTYGDKIIATWRNEDKVRRFDEKKFSDENPDTYQKYLYVSEGKRKFNVKL